MTIRTASNLPAAMHVETARCLFAIELSKSRSDCAASQLGTLLGTCDVARDGSGFARVTLRH
jgi:hypothetical protein